MSVKTYIGDLNDNYYLFVKATLNMYVFRTDLKFSRYDTFLISASKVGPTTLNAQSPYDLSRDTDTCYSM